jgi:hypothetical protein
VTRPKGFALTDLEKAERFFQDASVGDLMAAVLLPDDPPEDLQWAVSALWVDIAERTGVDDAVQVARLVADRINSLRGVA